MGRWPGRTKEERVAEVIVVVVWLAAAIGVALVVLGVLANALGGR